jgi:hypothetical protein
VKFYRDEGSQENRREISNIGKCKREGKRNGLLELGLAERINRSACKSKNLSFIEKSYMKTTFSSRKSKISKII